MQASIAMHLEEVTALCARFRVRRLDLFGSAARQDFDPSQSDIDLLVEFEPGGQLRALDQYFGLKEAFEALLGRPVDLVVASAVRNPYIRESIERSRETLYAA